jgi:hypothetical protein
MCDNLGISDNKIEVYELQLFGSKIILNSLKEVADILEADLCGIEFDEPEKIIVTRKMMRESELQNLPEFEGY